VTDQQSISDSTFDLQSPHLDRDGRPEDPVLALASPSSGADDDLDIFQFFARGPGRDSIATTSSDGAGSSKAVVMIAQNSVKPCTSPRVVRRNLPKVDEEDIWFSKVECLL
jgi:hypothetical protein